MKILHKQIILLIILISFVVPIYSQVFLPPYVTDNQPTEPDDPDPILNDPVGKPYGGGAGYFPIYESSECDIVVNSDDFSNLKNIVENASYGDIIYIDDNLTIEIPAYNSFTIPSGVTLASGRGNNGSQGALIYLDYKYSDSNWHHHIYANSNVRITGLRFRGPDDSKILTSANYCPGGIYQNSGTNLEIDNCELYNWYWIAIRLVYSTNANIHHNYIHNNQKPGAGYGVQVGWKSNANISYNIFNYNRHSIASNGDAVNGDLPSYKAEYNLVLPCGYDFRFEVHGYRDEYKNDPTMLASCDYWDPDCNKAGDLIEIYNNYFTTIQTNQYMVMFRGIPNTGGYVSNNYFNQYDRSVRQRLAIISKVNGNCVDPNDAATVQPDQSNPWCYYWGKLDVASNNLYISSNDYDADIHIRQIDWGGDSEGYSFVGPEVLFTSTNSFEYGDFNSDGRTDIINQGFISYSGFTDWEVYIENYTIDPNHIIDFNGDGLEDIIQITHPTAIWPNGCY